MAIAGHPLEGVRFVGAVKMVLICGRQRLRGTAALLHAPTDHRPIGRSGLVRILEKQNHLTINVRLQKKLDASTTSFAFQGFQSWYREDCDGWSLVQPFVAPEESPNTTRQHASRKRGNLGRKLQVTESITENIPPRTILAVPKAPELAKRRQSGAGQG